MDWPDRIADTLEVVRDTFGEEVQYLGDETKPPLNIIAVFDQPSLHDDMDYPGMDAYETRLSGTEPRLFVKLMDLPQKPQQGDEVEVRGVWYQVIDIDQDGHGGADLILQKVR